MERDRTMRWDDGPAGALLVARDTISDVGKEARQVIQEVGQAVGPLRTTLEQTITAHPLKAIMAALAAGVLLGWLIKRS